MKKYILYLVLVLLSIFQVLPSLEAVSGATVISPTEQYTKGAIQTVKNYVTRLERAGFSDAEIATTLEKIRTIYVQRKAERSYTGVRKIKIDALIRALDTTIAIKKASSEDDEDIYDLFMQIPICSTGILTDTSCICKDGSSPRPLASGTRIQIYTCDPIVVTPPVCTKEYAPVCGQPKMPACQPGMSCIQVMPVPKTYDNKCMMNSVGASYLYGGICKTETPPPTPICATGTLTDSSCVCKDGSSPRPLASGTRIQTYTCDPIVVTPPTCTKEYAPVCAQMPRLSLLCPAGSDTCSAPLPQTYDNKCMMNSAGASYLYSGVCKTPLPVDIVTCTKEYAPVCGQPKSGCTTLSCAGVSALPETYSNTCELTKASATYLYSGVCKNDM